MSERLLRLRDRARSQIILILRFGEKLTDATPVEDIKGRLEILEQRYQTFNEIELQLFEDQAYESITDAVDEIFYKARAILRTACGYNNGKTNGTQDLNTTLEQFIEQQKTFYEGVNMSQHVRLPKIDIEKFSGDYKHWASFHDLFVTTVHSNQRISDVHKLQMLKGLLTSEAADLIRHIPITDSNYAEAWRKLCNRYNKLTPIITSLVQGFFDQKSCTHSNGRELRRITETADEIIRGLRALGPNAETRDPWLIHILLSKIDTETKQLWATESVKKDFSSFDDMLQFLNQRCDALEICEAANQRGPTKPSLKTFISTDTNTSVECYACKQQHPLFRCPVFKNKTLEARMQLVTEMNLCRNCLKRGHVSASCFSKSSCLICSNRHHTLIHAGHLDAQPRSSQTYTAVKETPAEDPTKSNSASPPIQTTTNTSVLHSCVSLPTTVLPTAVVYAETRTGELQSFRALLDSGSQSSFVTESCARRLDLMRSQASTIIYGLGSATAGQSTEKINMTIHSRINKQYTIHITAHIISNITNSLPTTHIRYNKHLLAGFKLTDPQFCNPNKIDILLGADVFFQILSPENRVINGLPTLQASKLGWLIAGTWNTQSTGESNFHSINRPEIQNDDNDIHKLLHKFWEVEEIAEPVTQYGSDHPCEIYYDQTTIRNPDGRFVVRLPFKDSRPALGNSYDAARQRLLAMERKFLKMPDFFDSYKSFMKEYISLGHMTYIPLNEIPESVDDKYFLPHHAVVKDSSSTTKLRVVFDGSCKTKTQISLNDILQIGPNIQTDLTKILLKFRQPVIALVADVEKMYRQILVTREDANYQLILWRENPSDQPKAYKLNTVTYGTACAPYLAVKTLHTSADMYQDLYPKGAHTIKHHFYIDDMLTGCDTVADAVELKHQLTEILSKTGFNLRKWRSNSPEFLNTFSREQIETIPKLIEDDPSIKTLGLMWNSDSDTLSFRVQNVNKTIWTKRTILSTASKVYDPLGYLSPTIILFKILLQKIWLLNLDWDAKLPNQIINSWQCIYQSLPALEKIQIPRCLTIRRNLNDIQLHAFCDASEAAYGCVIYLRSVNDIGEVTVNIVYGKSKVSPIKQVTLPRLELCGAVLLCKSVNFCIQSLAYQDVNVYAWTDSMIVLHWLSDVPRRWKGFIGNRTSFILQSMPLSRWRHVSSKENPADIISRGAKPQDLPNSRLWWNGPSWLCKPEDSWPKPKSTTVPNDEMALEERPRYVNVMTETITEDDVISNLLTKCSSWFTIRKIMVYVLRFGRAIQNLKKGPITPIELNAAETVIIRNIQKTVFNTELSLLNKTCTIPSKNTLSSLDPFIDAVGLLRVGGRLKRSSLSYTARHPVVLPKSHTICELIIRDIHINNMHAGNSLTLSILRTKYWMIGARRVIKKLIRSCTVCTRFRFTKIQQKMADLPAARCNQSRPFSKTGLDYAGPLYIKNSKRRNSPVEKAYVAVFVCLAVKAVHLEVVSGLDTESFLAALKRFVSRRGTPEEIWCDNGSNFIGANSELKQLKSQLINQISNRLISDFLLQKNIIFHFNPPHAPHFGGLWEATVKSFKFHLKRVANINLTFEEMTTLIVQIEGLLNSRPICKIHDDPTDLEILTPAHFLVGDSLAAIPEPTLDDVPSSNLSRWQNIQQRLQGFWKRWHHDYLSSLQHRYKWRSTTHKFEVDDVVLIREDNLYPSQWILGRIKNVHPGSDGVTRVVTLQTAKGEIKRPVHKLIALPVKE